MTDKLSSKCLSACGIENSSRDARNGFGIQPLFCQGRLQEFIRKEMIVFLPMEFRSMFGDPDVETLEEWLPFAET